MKQWEHHVIKEGKTTYCGHTVSLEWYFVNKGHAITSVNNGDWVQPCPDCWRQILKESEITFINNDLPCAKDKTTIQ